MVSWLVCLTRLGIILLFDGPLLALGNVRHHLSSATKRNTGADADRSYSFLVCL